MPVRSRSRCSRSTRNWSAFCDRSRSSSSSSSKPVASTPPSRITTGGLSTMAVVSRCARLGCRRDLVEQGVQGLLRGVFEAGVHPAGSCARPSRSTARSRGGRCAGPRVPGCARDRRCRRGSSRNVSMRSSVSSRSIASCAPTHLDLIAQRAADPALSVQAAAHRRRRGIEQAVRGCARRSPDAASISSRLRRVAASIAIASSACTSCSRLMMRQGTALGLRHILQQRARGGDRQRPVARSRSRTGRACRTGR
jgi:hypothetical protein